MVMNLKATGNTLRSSQDSIGLIPVQDALAMINQFDNQLKQMQDQDEASLIQSLKLQDGTL